ncbi:anti-sigma factor [Acidovorax sp.]|jgi:anti-sigma factor RsiW|uniref:anti-sigma factor family protein n=1 Tax=Acidovorax sp. TaxID=1872122 RepID=UPI0025BBE71C|nr:anti-sigma factor [Acidovorax sp.]MCI5067933.1 anti-sigma factor [Acidovorax sp.]
MDRNAPHPAPDDAGRRDWHALVDDRLPPAEAEALRQELAGDPAAQETIARWQHQRAQLRALHQDLERAPVPEALLQAALAAAAGQARRHADWWRWGGMAASVLAAFGLGWMGHGQWAGHGAAAGIAGARGMAVPAAAPAQRFAQQAAVAHAVYQPEVRHPVEVTAAQQDHLVQWLSKRLERPLKVPVLSPQGYELVGGRLLPGDTGARAQFMYQNGTGQRITLYLGALPKDAAQHPSSPASSPAAAPSPAPTAAFQFTHDGPVPAFYWVEQNFGYALSGQLPQAELLALATSIYQQLQ